MISFISPQIRNILLKHLFSFRFFVTQHILPQPISKLSFHPLFPLSYYFHSLNTSFFQIARSTEAPLKVICRLLPILYHNLQGSRLARCSLTDGTLILLACEGLAEQLLALDATASTFNQGNTATGQHCHHGQHSLILQQHA